MAFRKKVYRSSKDLQTDRMVGPGVVTHAYLVNGLRVKQLQKDLLNANGFLSRCQNERYVCRGALSPILFKGMPR